MSASALRIGTRGSQLALFQTEAVRRALVAVHPWLDGAIEVVVIRTTGDIVRDRVLAEIGGKGLFAKEIEEALLDRHIDLAVHSMKDLPTWLPAGLGIASVLKREDPRDGLLINPRRCGEVRRLVDLPPGITVGTSSPRRQAQIMALRRDIKVVPARGNVDTRVAKLDDGVYDATVLALCGFRRLGIEARIDAVLAPDEMLPAAAQGVIAIECRMDDTRTLELCAAIDDTDSHLAAHAERAMLAALDGSCRTPIGALAALQQDGRLSLSGMIAMPDGSALERAALTGAAADARDIGHAVGHELRDRAGPSYFLGVA
jgi:hydroxymethylbilane synthase